MKILCLTLWKTVPKELDEENLTKEQEKELEEAIKEADAGETVSFEEFKQSMSRWLTK